MNGGDIGTYGVLSVGVAGQVVNTGWLGDAQFDYENGADIRGWAASGGIRYQFTPEVPRTAMSPRRPLRPLQDCLRHEDHFARLYCRAGLRPFSPDILEIGRAGPNLYVNVGDGNTLNSAGDLLQVSHQFHLFRSGRCYKCQRPEFSRVARYSSV